MENTNRSTLKNLNNMSKILTAEELFIKYNPQDGILPDWAKQLMIEFAELHVKAALEAVLESIPCLGSSTDIATYEEVEKAVLNSYPKNLIK